MSDHLDAMRNFVNAMNQGSPHAIALKMETVSLDSRRGRPAGAL
jgi:hypothetical protein